MSVFYNEARGRWQYDFQRKGERFAGYADHPETGVPAKNKRQALEIEALLKARADTTQKAELKVAANPIGFTFGQAVAYYAKNVGQTRKTWEGSKKRHLKELLTHFGADTIVEDMTVSDIRAYIAWSRKQDTLKYVGGPKSGGKLVSTGNKRAPRTINGYLVTLAAVLHLCAKDEKVKRVPHVPLEKAPEDIPNPVRREDLARIWEAAPGHLKDVIVLCAFSGMRQDECLLLTWDRVDLAGGRVTLLGADVKANKGRTVYLNDVTKGVLERLWTERPKDAKGRYAFDRVILFRQKGKGQPKPINSISTAWRLTLQRVGLMEKGAYSGQYRFHDLRAAFCTYLAEMGTDAVHLKDAAGHASIQTTLKYIKAVDARTHEAVKGMGSAFGSLFGTSGSNPLPNAPNSDNEAQENQKVVEEASVS